MTQLKINTYAAQQLDGIIKSLGAESLTDLLKKVASGKLEISGHPTATIGNRRIRTAHAQACEEKPYIDLGCPPVSFKPEKVNFSYRDESQTPPKIYHMPRLADQFVKIDYEITDGERNAIRKLMSRTAKSIKSSDLQQNISEIQQGQPATRRVNRNIRFPGVSGFIEELLNGRIAIKNPKFQ